MPSTQNDSSSNLANTYVQHKHHSHNSLILGSAVAGCTSIIIVMLFGCCAFYDKLKTRRTSPYDLHSINLEKFSYRKLKSATNGFSDKNKIGQGGFGAVYKGVFRNGQEVAVKHMDTSTTSQQGEREFQNELMVIGGINSPYIVSLLGFCADKSRRLLVYEYMQNRSLQEALFDEDNPITLDWRTRFNIIVDVAHSLAFLHMNCDPPIIHGDVKPSNVLLDSNFSARLADFGLARLKSEVLGFEARSEDVEGDSFEQERIRHERMARAKERKLRRKAERRKAQALNEDTNGEKNSEEHKKEASITLKNPSLQEEEEEGLASEADNSPFTYRQGFSEHDKECVIEMIDDGVKAPMSEKDLSSAFDSLATATVQEFKCPDMDAKNDVSLPNAVEQEDDRSKSNPVDENLDENQSDTPRSGSCFSDQKDAKDDDNCNRNWWWKQEADYSIKDYTANWLASEVKEAQSSCKDWNWREENPSEEGRSHDKKKGGRERSMSLERWGQFLRELSCKDFPNKNRKRSQSKSTESKEADRRWWMEDRSGEVVVGGMKSTESKSGAEKRRDIRDCLSDERNEELNKKAKNSKLEGKLQKCFPSINIRMSKETSCSFDLSGELKQQSRWAPQRQCESSKNNKEWWSGDLLSWNRGRDSASVENSGELTSGPGPVKEPRQQEGRRDCSRSREWWSGDLSSRALSSTSSMRGTVCYVAPEYGGGGILTEKSDVYSYGVLMLVIISGRRPLQVVASPAEFDRSNLISWARILAQTGNILDLVDASMQDEYSEEQALLCITLALLCLQRLPAIRPTMVDVLKILLGEKDIPALPFEFSPSPPLGQSLQNRKRLTSDFVPVELSLLA